MKFEQWLNNPVRIGECGIQPRKIWLRDFVKKGLYPWIISKGYTWGITESHLRNCIATGLYENRKRHMLASKWDYSFVNEFENEDHKMHFYHIIGTDEWESFWNLWGNMSDLSDDSPRGQDRRIDIQEFIWGQLDLSRSPQTDIVNELLDDMLEDEIDDRRSNRIDIYLQESHD